MAKVHGNWTVSQKCSTAWAEEDSFLGDTVLSLRTVHAALSGQSASLTIFQGERRKDGPTRSRIHMSPRFVEPNIMPAPMAWRGQGSSVFTECWLERQIVWVKSLRITVILCGLGQVNSLCFHFLTRKMKETKSPNLRPMWRLNVSYQYDYSSLTETKCHPPTTESILPKHYP